MFGLNNFSEYQYFAKQKQQDIHERDNMFKLIEQRLVADSTESQMRLFSKSYA